MNCRGCRRALAAAEPVLLVGASGREYGPGPVARAAREAADAGDRVKEAWCTKCRRAQARLRRWDAAGRPAQAASGVAPASAYEVERPNRDAPREEFEAGGDWRGPRGFVL